MLSSEIRRFILILVSSIVLSSCWYLLKPKIIVQNDELKNTKSAYLKLYLSAEEKRTDVYGATLTFLVNKKHNKSDFSVYTVISRSNKSFNLEDTFYFAVDNKKYELLTNQKSTETRIHYSEEKETQKINDSTEVEVVTGLNTSTWKQEKFSFSLTEPQINEIKKAQSLTFRFYAGYSYGTFIIDNKELSKLKKLFALPL